MHIASILKPNKKTLLKIISLFFGYTLWVSIGAWFPISHTVTVPLALYNQCSNHTIVIPEKVSVTLHGSRTLLSALDYTSLCAHIDASMLVPGKKIITLSSTDLLLPQEIMVKQYTPITIIVTLS